MELLIHNSRLVNIQIVTDTLRAVERSGLGCTCVRASSRVPSYLLYFEFFAATQWMHSFF